VVVTEGNYLLHPDWVAARAQLDEVWFLEAPDESVRVEHLIARHVRYGKDTERARTWVLTSDEANAAVVAGYRDHADRILRWTSWPDEQVTVAGT
jgi:pantothenate kinase